MLLGQLAEGAEWLERGLTHAEACNDQVALQAIIRSLVNVLVHGPMPVPRAIARCEELLEANRGERLLEAVIALTLSSLSAMAGRFEDYSRYATAAEPMFGRVDTMFAALGQRHVADAKELVGDLAGAIEAEKAKWLFFGGATDRRPADGRAIDSAEGVALFCSEAGLWDEAEEWIARSRSLRRRDAGRKAVEARLAAHRGDHAEALRLAREVVERAETTDRLNQRARRWRILAEVQRAAGQADEADAALARAIELYEQKGNVAAAARAR